MTTQDPQQQASSEQSRSVTARGQLDGKGWLLMVFAAVTLAIVIIFAVYGGVPY